MEKFNIPADPRLITRLVKAGTQGDAVRALLELINNSDDSYKRLEEKGISHDGLIELQYQKDGRRVQFLLRDNAEGMSYNDLLEAFSKYGAPTSGYKEDKLVTGFFGTGAKNALASMTDGKISTIKDNLFCELNIFIEDHCLKGTREGPLQATKNLRSRYGIENNGTVASFIADPSKNQQAPRFDTIFECLANHWRLRKIMTNPQRKVILYCAP